MAQRKKDVELVVRAKDQASKTVDAISGAISDLVAAQTGLSDSAAKSDSALDKLGGAFGRMSKELRGLTVVGKLESEFGKAAAAIDRLEKAEAGSVAESARLSAEVAKGVKEYERLALAADKAKAAVDREKTAKTGAKAAQTQANAALRAGVSARDKLVSSEARLAAQIEKQQQAVRETGERYARLAAQVAEADAPTKRLTQTFERTGGALDTAKAKLAGLEEKLARTKTSAADAAVNVSKLEAAALEAAAGFTKQGKALSAATEQYRQTADATKASGQHLAALRADSEKLEASLEGQRDSLVKARVEYAQFGAAVDKAGSALRELGVAATGELEAGLADQTVTVRAAKKEWDAAAGEALRLGQQLSRLEDVAANSIFGNKAANEAAKLSRTFEEAKVTSKAASAEYELQQQALRELGAVAKDTGGDIDQLAARQQRFREIQESTGQTLAKMRAAAEGQVVALRKQAAESDRAARATHDLDGAMGRTNNRMRAARTAGDALGNAYRKLYGDSRQALSIQQRMRGEILALTNSYLGLFAVLQGVRGVQTAFEELQSAQIKLGVPFEGARVATEVDVARNAAARLGFEFGSLAQSYANLQIATSASAVSAGDTRKLFLAVSQAGRVLQLDNERLKRTFTAFSQIAQKGVVSMEELRQQLSENFPGSIEIFAKAAGYGAGELDKFYKAVGEGKVSADILGNVADEINAKYGGQVAESLNTVSVAFGRLQNAIFESSLVIGNAGLLDSLKDLYNTLSEVSQTSEFTAFLTRLGKGASALVDTVAFLSENFEGVITVLSALVGIKAASFFLTFATGMIAATKQTTAFRVAAIGATGSVGRLRLAFVGLKVAMRAALISTGIGAIIVGLTVLFGSWLTAVEDTTRAMDTHEKIVRQVKGAYDAAGGSLEKWRESLDKITVTQARKNLADLVDAIDLTGRKLQQAANAGGGTAGGRFFGVEFNGAAREYRNAIDDVIESLVEGDLALVDVRDELDAVSEKYRDGSAANARLAAAVDEASASLEEQFDAAAEAQDILLSLTGTADEQAAALERLATRYGDVKTESEQAASSQKRWSAALGTLRDALPELNKEMSAFEKTSQGIEAALQSAITAARALPESIQRIGAEQQALAEANAALIASAQTHVDANFGSFTDGLEASLALVREFEGFRADPYYDVTAYRAGYGSDTVTLRDGSVKKVVQGISVSVADANRDLMRRITTEFMPIARNAAGSARFDTFSAQQQAALTSIAYNYGEIPGRIVAAVRTGTAGEIADAIRGLGGDNNGDNRSRRRQEAALFTSTAGAEPAALKQQREALALEKAAAREAERKAKAQADFRTGLDASIAQQQFELSLENQGLLKSEVAKALREAELEAKKAGLALTQADIAAITKVTEAKFRQQAAEDATTDSRERAAKAEQVVNDLISRRGELERQLEIFRENGDTEKTATAVDEIKGINVELEAAVENAVRMWAAIGGGGADAAIAKLQTAKLEAANMDVEGQKNIVTWESVGKVFGGRLLSAFDQFSQAVAEGKSIGEAARTAFLQFASDFLREIAQMIIKQTLLNALKGLGGGGGFLGGIISGLAHTGGVVGSSRTGSGNGSRKVAASAFATAGRFHEGGLPGLRSDEVATILRKGEEVVTENDPRHVLNGGGATGGGGSAAANVKIVNTFDAADMLDVALQDSRGQQVLVNAVQSNATAVKAALGG